MKTPELQSEAVLSAELLLQARRLAQQDGVSVLQAIERLVPLAPAEVMAVLGARFGYAVLAMTDLQALRANFDGISYTDALSRGVFAGSSLSPTGPVLVLSDPFDGATENWALQRLGLYPAPRVALAHPADLQAFLAQQERQMRAMDGFDAQGAELADESVVSVISLTSISEDSSPVVKLVNSTIYDALKLQASDIHLECDAGCLRVLYRIDGVMVEVTQVAGLDTAEQVISRIKVMAELDIAERRVPQDGRFRVRVNARDIDFRVSVMPNIYGEDAVLRLLDRQSLSEQAQALSLEKLGLDAHTIGPIRRLASKPHGMLLVTGPTGSGKTTTLYAAITEINTGRDKIVTIEDPVEYRLARVLQIPVNEKKGLTFARGLRSILRHDPDKIMVGEIRDDETAQIAVQAALTGHLVYTTVHANNVFDVLGRFLHMGVDAYSFAAALNGIVSQRLLRLTCVHCAVRAEPDDDVLAAAQMTRSQVAHWSCMAGTGCAHCRGAGYKGRKAVAEVLVLDDGLRELIASRAPVSVLKERARQAGLRSLQESALQWVADGRTTLEEVLRVAG